MQNIAANVVSNNGATYTQAQLLERLTAANATYGNRFDILDSSLNVVQSKGTIQAMSASVEWDSNRQLMGSLGMVMLPNELINTPFRYRIKPWFRLQMLDGGIAEWPLGVYVWNIPNRRSVGLADEEWDVTLADLSHILQLSGPGPDGFVLAKGQHLVHAIHHILVHYLGITDLSGIPHSDMITTTQLHWGITSTTAKDQQQEWRAAMQHYDVEMNQYHKALAAYHHKKHVREERIKYERAHPTYSIVEKGHWAGGKKHRHWVETAHRHKNKIKYPPMPHPPIRPHKPRKPPRFHGTTGNTWFDILSKLHAHLGWHPPWFDLTGRYRGTPLVNLLTAPPSKVYQDGQHGTIVLPMHSTGDFSHLANRVIAEGKSVNGLYDLAISDLNKRAPTHPLAQQNIGFYIDIVVHDPHAASQRELQTAADLEMDRRMVAYQQITLDTLIWPAHESHDIIEVIYSTDAEYNNGITCLETSWDADLFTGVMTHTLGRITPQGTGPSF